mmetsp:Transcript_82002/g.123135  ORF Transcript_82002/g.123135 Transcript_82002/m.123135 type:complete len:205 (-) Transcript_82002:608-1222(-)
MAMSMRPSRIRSFSVPPQPPSRMKSFSVLAALPLPHLRQRLLQGKRLLRPMPRTSPSSSRTRTRQWAVPSSLQWVPICSLIMASGCRMLQEMVVRSRSTTAALSRSATAVSSTTLLFVLEAQFTSTPLTAATLLISSSRTTWPRRTRSSAVGRPRLFAVAVLSLLKAWLCSMWETIPPLPETRRSWALPLRLLVIQSSHSRTRR